MKQIISIIGSGNMGTALAEVIADNGYTVKIWSIEKEVLREVARCHTNKKYLPGIKLSSEIIPVFDLKKCIAGANVIVLAVPSAVIKKVVKQIKLNIENSQLIVSFAKGLEASSGRDMYSLIVSEFPRGFHKNVLVVSGPSIAGEFVRKKPARVAVAGKSKNNFQKIKKILANSYFGVVPSGDIIGIELGGVLKNVYAIALGMCDGLHYSVNTKSILAVQALEEMSGFIIKLGGKKESAYGLAGLGDLLATGFSEFSRNRTFGEKICLNKSCSQTLKNMTQVVEGVPAAKIIYRLAKKYKVKMPLMEAVYGVLYKGKDPCKTLEKFLEGDSC